MAIFYENIKSYFSKIFTILIFLFYITNYFHIAIITQILIYLISFEIIKSYGVSFSVKSIYIIENFSLRRRICGSKLLRVCIKIHTYTKSEDYDERKSEVFNYPFHWLLPVTAKALFLICSAICL